MPKSIIARFGTCLTTLFCLTNCSSNSSAPAPESNASGGETSTVGGNSTGTVTTSGGATIAAGGATIAAGGNTIAAGGNTIAAGGNTALGGASTAAGGNTALGGATIAAGGNTALGGASTAAGGKATGGTTSSGGTSLGGATIAAGGKATGGTTSLGGATATGGAGGAGAVDCLGQALAKPGDRVSTSRGYLNLGDMRLINNRWGSDELSCSGTTMSVFTSTAKVLGWDFNRPTCGGANAKPDYPELEFGVAPFGTGNDASLLTSPSCSSTSLLPIQLKNITSASITLTNYSITLPNPSCGCTTSGTTTTCTCSWNLNFEFWLSNDNPITNPNPGVYAELIGFWGWQGGRWPCDTTLSKPTVTSSGKTYHICHQSDTWNSTTPHWRYFQFWDNAGPQTSFNGKVDLKPFIDWLVNNYAVPTDKWLTRIEIGTEIDDKTSGSVSLQNAVFEINGVSKSPQFAQ